MKRPFCLAIAVLVSASLWAQDGKPLSYAAEYETPGWNADDLYHRLREWDTEDYYFQKEHFGLTQTHSDFDAKVFKLSGQFWDFKMKDSMFAARYSVAYVINVACYDGRMLVDLSNIKAWVGDSEIWKYWEYDYLTQGPEGVRRDFFGWYYAPQADRKIRAWLESWFAEISEILYQAIAAAAPPDERHLLQAPQGGSDDAGPERHRGEDRRV